jgi:hypothetical protein
LIQTAKIQKFGILFFSLFLRRRNAMNVAMKNDETMKEAMKNDEAMKR